MKLLSLFDAIGTIQLDAINVVERTQFLVPFSRLGAYNRAHFHALNGPGGALFEYWGHAASLMPVAQHPLFRWRMDLDGYEGGPTLQARRAAYAAKHRDYIDAVLREVRERGPLAASELEDPRRRDGEWWDRRSLGRVALEHLFAKGQLAGWRAPNFERIYDLPARVIPPAVLEAPVPTREEAHRQLVRQAARAHGVATIGDLSTYYFTKARDTTPRVSELVEDGVLQRVDVEGWPLPGYMLASAKPTRPRRAHATLLSPFDSLIWDRARALRLFGFDYRIEVYTPAAKRRYGYYVMPLLFGDALVGRFDLKADRKASTLRVLAAHAEPGTAPAAVAEPACEELHQLRSWLELEQLAIGRKGNLSGALARVARRKPG
jgi:uncharacterized protein YcaQ